MMKNLIPPGAYYNPSGITVSTIGFSTMVRVGYKLENTIELMGFTVEEKRLIGSREIALQYRMIKIHVIGTLNSDVVGYKGNGGFGIFITKDEMSNQEQSSLLIELMNRYLHRLEHRLSDCPYACSDHASCNKNSYSATTATDCLISPDWHKTFDLVKNIGGFPYVVVYYLAENSKGTSHNNGSIPFGGRFENGVTRERTEEKDNGKQHFMVEVPNNVSHFTIWIQGHMGDAELFLRLSRKPKIDNYDFGNWNFDSSEQFEINTNGAGVYHIIVKGFGVFGVLH